jgi:hypothetical protein
VHQLKVNEAMPGSFRSSATALGGACSDFKQKDYISANKWDAPNPMDRQGAIQKGSGLKCGVCLGLSAIYLASHGDWSVFLNTISSPGGLAHVRGFMNLQSVGVDAKKISYQDESGPEFVRECLRTLGVQYSGQQRIGQNTDVTGGLLGMAVQDGRFLIGFKWSLGSHATAAILNGGRYKAFDPELGAADLPDGTAFASFVQGWLGYYPGIKWWFVQRYL